MKRPLTIDLAAITKAVLKKKLYKRLRGYRTLFPTETGTNKKR